MHIATSNLCDKQERIIRNTSAISLSYKYIVQYTFQITVTCNR